MERLLVEQQSVKSSLATPAKAAGVSTATADRHVSDTGTALEAYYSNLVDELISEISAVPAEAPPIDRFEMACRIWGHHASRWSRAAVYIRSADGFLARLRADDPVVTRIFDVPAPITIALMQSGGIPTRTRNSPY